MRTARLLLLALICTLFVSTSNAQNGITVSPWRMYRGEIIKLDKQKTVLTKHGDPAAYSVMNIPDKSAEGWEPAKYGSDGEVIFQDYSTLPCDFSQIQPTYFETVVTIPAGTKVTTFSVSYLKADDGARIHIFNSKYPYPKGAFDAKADLSYGQVNTGAINLSGFVTQGENRVVIAQYDDCGAGKSEYGNSVHGINIKVNGEEVKPQIVAAKSQLLANEFLTAGQKLASPDGAFSLIMQADGNVVIYTADSKPIWATQTQHKSNGGKFTMQPDGNLVLYKTATTTPLWNSETHPFFDKKYASADMKPVKAVLENDGALVLYSGSNKKVWSSKK